MRFLFMDQDVFFMFFLLEARLEALLHTIKLWQQLFSLLLIKYSAFHGFLILWEGHRIQEDVFCCCYSQPGLQKMSPVFALLINMILGPGDRMPAVV